MATGTVKWFNDSKGFGFTTPSEGGEDLFAHHTAIQMSGFKTLKEGQKVEFEVKRGPKGLQAANIKPTVAMIIGRTIEINPDRDCIDIMSPHRYHPMGAP